MKKAAIKQIVTDTLPVLAGYLFLGIGFGILLQQAGYGIGWSLSMSVFIYAGSMQYLAVSLLASQAPLLSTLMATLLVNARHLFYGISLLDTYRNTGKKKPYLIFALTDETYSLVTQKRPPAGISRTTYCFLVSLLDHIYWILGCALGSWVGAVAPINFEGVEFFLTALFVTLFVEQWLSTQNHRPALIGVVTTIVCLLIFGKEIFLIPAMVAIALLLTVSGKTAKEKSHE